MSETSTPRRSQAERSASTIAKVLDATLEVLAEQGYHGTTTSLVAKTAGVSRGAMLHHFPTRADLVLGAAERLLETEVGQFRSAMAAIPQGADRYHAAIDFLWRTAQGDSHLAWTELSLGARTDPDLADAVSQFNKFVNERIRDTWADTFPEAQNLPFAGIAPDFAGSLLDGLAQRKLTGGLDGTRAGEVVEALKDLSTLLLAPQGDTP